MARTSVVRRAVQSEAKLRDVSQLESLTSHFTLYAEPPFCHSCYSNLSAELIMWPIQQDRLDFRRNPI